MTASPEKKLFQPFPEMRTQLLANRDPAGWCSGSDGRPGRIENPFFCLAPGVYSSLGQNGQPSGIASFFLGATLFGQARWLFGLDLGDLTLGKFIFRIAMR